MEENDDFEHAVQKANKMASTIKKKSQTSGKRKNTDDEENEDDVIKRYGLDDYDDEELPSDLTSGIGGLTPFTSNDEDPYITLKDEVDSDDEDFVLKPTDNLIALGRVTEEAAVLEVYIYNAELNNLFIHHDYILPTFPLVLEWMDYDVAEEEPGNFVAMGTMEPDIGIWDLDVVDSLEPVAVLQGNRPEAKKKKKKKLEKKGTLGQGHSDAVLDLSWNSHVRNVLASASADKTVCLWDLSKGEVVSVLGHHQQQVQCASWHPQESQTLLTGSFDNYAAVIDCRDPSENVKKWKFSGEVERATWNHFNPFNFLASTDRGMLYEVDVRQEKPLFTLSAHEEAVTGMALSSQIPGLLVTSSPDKHLKVWDIQDSRPALVLNRNLHMDILHCVTCNPDHPFVFAVGANKDFKVWDIRESAAVRGHFLKRMPANIAMECAEDDQDLGPDGEEALGAMAGLRVQVRGHFLKRMPANIAMECAEDDQDLGPDGEEALGAMADLRVQGDDDDDAEEEEMLAGDRPGAKKGAGGATHDGDGKKKKKKKKRKKKTLEV
ncbi:periodic tryptophan protein 1 homolog [Plakobranchus ocellatus]|uniref:Periodic tryptophan protein 1 homolog n=1 Tax=Plakobranchus ocellatus TaxID=259542 RepID=A0AAV4CAE2_9GAST|nr:periodic tryptophan protein 1 homolog [Plakobranchus ocellatus]